MLLIFRELIYRIAVRSNFTIGKIQTLPVDMLPHWFVLVLAKTNCCIILPGLANAHDSNPAIDRTLKEITVNAIYLEPVCSCLLL